MCVLKQKKSAKDIAFEKERAKFRSEIRKLTDCLENKQKQISCLTNVISEKENIIFEKENIIRQQTEWIDRLLEYAELSEEDMKKIINKEKAMSEIIEYFQSMTEIMGRFGL